MYESEAWRFRIGYPGGTSLAPDETSGAPRLKMGTGEYAVTVIRFRDSPIVLTPEGLDAFWVEHTDQDIVRIFTETWHADLAENVYSDVGTVEYVGVWRDSPRGTVSWRMDSTGTLHGEKEWLTTIFVQTWHTTYAITAVYDTLDVRSDVEGIIQSFEVVSPPAPPAFVTCARSVNVRSGPGTNHAIISQLAPYEPVEIVGRNEASSWRQVCCFDGEKGWVAASVTTAHGELGELQVVLDIPTPTPVPLLTTGMGDEIEGAGWRFKVSEIHKRKAVYFYDYSHVAHGHFLVVIIDATNVQSGSDCFANNLAPAITDESHNKYMPSAKGTRYARWQYGGLTDVFTDVNPGAFARIALAYDLPDHLGAIALITPLGHRIDLGNFSAMPLEE